MARKIKESIDYLKLPCGFFSDKRIKRLKKNYGSKGIVIYLCIKCEIGNTHGYYTELDDDLIESVADALNVKECLVRQVIEYLFERSLLTKILSGQVTYITSAECQDDFQKAKTKTGEKRGIIVERQIWLLKPEDTAGFIKVYPIDNKSAYQSDKSAYQSDKSAEKSAKISKDKISKDIIINNNMGGKPPDENKRSVFKPPTVEEVREYCKSRNNSVDAETFVDFYSSKGWFVGKNKMKDWKAAVRTWERNRNANTSTGTRSERDVDSSWYRSTKL